MSVLPEPEGERQAVASTLAVIRNCSVPFGAPYGDFGIYNTEYRTVMNLTSCPPSWLAATGRGKNLGETGKLLVSLPVHD